MTELSRLFLQLLLLTPLGAQDGAPPVGIRIIANSGTETRVSAVRECAARGLRRLAPHFPGASESDFSIHLHDDVDLLPDEVLSSLHPGTPGLALLERDEIHLILGEVQRQPPNDLQTVVDHELVHILLHRFAGPAGSFVPRWFHEGLAQHLSGDTYLGSREEDLIYPAHTGRLLRFRHLRRDFPDSRSGRRMAYAESFSFLSYLVREVGLHVVIESARHCTDEDGYAAGFLVVTGEVLASSESRWLDYLANESGAAYRVVLQNCFSYLMIGGFVLLALAGIRKWNRDLRFRAKLEREEQQEFTEPDPADDRADPGTPHPGAGIERPNG